MRIYVMGANCKPYQFEEAALQLERKGYTPLLSQWFVPYGSSEIVTLRRSLETMLHCEALADVNPSQGDKRSALERALAFDLDMPIRPLSEWLAT